MNQDGSNFQAIHQFGTGPYPDGQYPAASLAYIGSSLYGTTTAGGGRSLPSSLSLVQRTVRLITALFLTPSNEAGTI